VGAELFHADRHDEANSRPQRNAIRERRRLEISADVFGRPFESGDHRAVLGHFLSHVHCGSSPTSTNIA